ncbi:hypothetical protein HC031_12045 [Planosporangium thailandense]|uniref:Uncharacterized protein n=1 Tax=Planosporangium thailandense TaxID=765197 RepID=A0ABX0XYV5_9ACTN|nr:hypothetical protein [Planosporangium thailandense]
MPGGAFHDQLAEQAVGPPAVQAQEVVIQPPTAAMVTGTPVARVVVAAQRLDQGARDRSTQCQPYLVVAVADFERTDRSGLRIKGIDPVDEIPESPDNVMRSRLRHARQ